VYFLAAIGAVCKGTMEHGTAVGALIAKIGLHLFKPVYIHIGAVLQFVDVIGWHPKNPVTAPEPHVVLLVPLKYRDEKKVEIGILLDQFAPRKAAALAYDVGILSYNPLFILYTEYSYEEHLLIPPEKASIHVSIIHPGGRYVNYCSKQKFDFNKFIIILFSLYYFLR